MNAQPNRPTDVPPLPAASPTDLPRLWPNLDPAQRRQLAQWVATLSRRLHHPPSSRLAETGHECS